MASPVRTAWRMHSPFSTGSMPGIAASTRLTCAFGSAPNAVAAPENSLDCETTCAWTSRPITTSHSPVSPWMRYSLILPPPGRLGRKLRAALYREAGVEDALFVEGAADDLQAQWQTFAAEARWHRHRRQTGQTGRHREHVLTLQFPP